MASLDESTLPLRPGPSRGTNHNLNERRSTGRQRPSRDDRMLKGVNKLIKNIYLGSSEVQKEDSEAITIKDSEFIGSYSWKDIEHPTIYVPGLPPKFTPPKLPVQLKKDNTTRSKPRSPAAPVDPLFETLRHQHPNFDMSSIDLVSDRNSLRNFLSFASKGPGKWRVDVDMVKSTMFFSQWEEFRLMMINGNQNSGYGHAFEDCVTTKDPEVKDSMHHERIVRYQLGGLECLVRFEADAYLDGDENDEVGKSRENLATGSSSDPPAPKPSRPVLKPPYKLVHVISRGHHVNPDQIAEIKSCSTPNNFNLKKALPQLWFSQTRHLCVGYHRNGFVSEKLEMKDMSREIEEWETNNQEQLKNMIRVIREIREIAKTTRKLTVICTVVDGMKCLSVFSRKGNGITIRPDVMERYWKNSGDA